MKKNELAKMIDHTALRACVTHDDLKVLCKEAVEYGFASVCVNPCNVNYVYELLKHTKVPVCSVVGFPLGASKTNVKVIEAKNAVDDGATEIDMVLNIGELKNKNYNLVERDVREVREAIGEKNVLKVIIEAALLTESEKVKATELVMSAGSDYVKTSTGMNSAGGATVQDVTLLRKTAKGKIKVKAAGGIQNRATAIAMIKAGADRIGASSSVKLVNEDECKPI